MLEHKYPAVAADIIIENKEKEILLIQRRYPPYEGMWAIPGGLLEYGKEIIEEAAKRELEEETGLKTKVQNLELFGVYSEPGRDPRRHTISVVYIAKRYEGELNAGDDAAKAKYFPVTSLPQLAFDHNEIIKDYISKR